MRFAMNWDWTTIFAWINTPWITIGKTPITAASVFGLLFILIFVWWFSAIVAMAMLWGCLSNMTLTV